MVFLELIAMAFSILSLLLSAILGTLWFLNTRKRAEAAGRRIGWWTHLLAVLAMVPVYWFFLREILRDFPVSVDRPLLSLLPAAFGPSLVFITPAILARLVLIRIESRAERTDGASLTADPGRRGDEET